MQYARYLDTITANRRARRARAVTRRLKRRVHIRRKARQGEKPSVVLGALGILAAVCVVYGVVFVMTQKDDPAPNIVEAPQGIANFFRKD